MKLSVRGDLSSSPLATQWFEALRPLILRHPNGESKVCVTLQVSDRLHLHVALDRTRDTSDRSKWMRSPFAIASVELTHFPGVKLARAWLAAGFVGYLTHEALELVTIDDLKTKVLDPHAEPYETNPLNRCLRDGLPTRLTPEALVDALCVVMPADAVSALIADSFDSDCVPSSLTRST